MGRLTVINDVETSRKLTGEIYIFSTSPSSIFTIHKFISCSSRVEGCRRKLVSFLSFPNELIRKRIHPTRKVTRTDLSGGRWGPGVEM